jgi:hypothetical protein
MLLILCLHARHIRRGERVESRTNVGNMRLDKCQIHSARALADPLDDRLDRSLPRLVNQDGRVRVSGYDGLSVYRMTLHFRLGRSDIRVDVRLEHGVVVCVRGSAQGIPPWMCGRQAEERVRADRDPRGCVGWVGAEDGGEEREEEEGGEGEEERDERVGMPARRALERFASCLWVSCSRVDSAFCRVCGS